MSADDDEGVDTEVQEDGTGEGGGNDGEGDKPHAKSGAAGKKKKREWQKVDTAEAYKKYLEANPPQQNAAKGCKKGKSKYADGEGCFRGKGKGGNYGALEIPGGMPEDDAAKSPSGSVPCELASNPVGYGFGGGVGIDGDLQAGGKAGTGKGRKPGGKGRDGPGKAGGALGKEALGRPLVPQGLGGDGCGLGPGGGAALGPGALASGSALGSEGASGKGLLAGGGRGLGKAGCCKGLRPGVQGEGFSPMDGGCGPIGPASCGGLGTRHWRPERPAGQQAVPPYGQFGGVAAAPYGGPYGGPGNVQAPYGMPAMPTMYAMPYYVMSPPTTPLGPPPSTFLGAGASGVPGSPSAGSPGVALLPPGTPSAALVAAPAERATEARREQVKSQVQSQIEYYFGQDNLIRDVFLRAKMNEEGWVPIALIAGFRRMQQMTTDITIILEAISASQKLEIDSHGNHVRLRDNWTEWLLTTNRAPSSPVTDAAPGAPVAARS